MDTYAFVWEAAHLSSLMRSSSSRPSCDRAGAIAAAAAAYRWRGRPHAAVAAARGGTRPQRQPGRRRRPPRRRAPDGPSGWRRNLPRAEIVRRRRSGQPPEREWGHQITLQSHFSHTLVTGHIIIDACCLPLRAQSSAELNVSHVYYYFSILSCTSCLSEELSPEACLGGFSGAPALRGAPRGLLT